MKKTIFGSPRIHSIFECELSRVAIVHRAVKPEMNEKKNIFGSPRIHIYPLNFWSVDVLSRVAIVLTLGASGRTVQRLLKTQQNARFYRKMLGRHGQTFRDFS